MTPSRNPSPTSRFAWDWAAAWNVVLAANLVGFFTFQYTSFAVTGRVGVWSALPIVYVFGLLLCGYRFRVGRSLVWGGAVLATTQFFPIVQGAAAVLAIAAWEGVGGTPVSGDFTEFRQPITDGRSRDPALVELGTFVVALLTAQLLMTLAVLLGVGLRIVFGDYPIWFARRTDPDADAS